MSAQWMIILYCYAGDRDGDRMLIGPYMSIREAELEGLRLDGYGEIEIRRVSPMEAVMQLLDKIPTA